MRRAGTFVAGGLRARETTMAQQIQGTLADLWPGGEGAFRIAENAPLTGCLLRQPHAAAFGKR